MTRLDFPVRVVLSEADTFKIPLALNIKNNFNLRDATRCRRDAKQLKLAEQAVVLGASTLAFVYLYKHTGLTVRVSRGNFGFLMET